jgi:DNA-binding transcriptional regulator YdaS (Cro superfamily)
MQLSALIEQAEKATGSTSALARALGVPNPVVFGWKAGTRTCTAEDRALIADIAGVDPFPEIAAALLERCAGKPKEAALRRALARGNLRI